MSRSVFSPLFMALFCAVMSPTGSFITSTASLGSLPAGSTVQLQFVGLWDNFTVGSLPNWEITSVSLVQVPEASTGAALLMAGILGASARRRRTL